MNLFKNSSCIHVLSQCNKIVFINIMTGVGYVRERDLGYVRCVFKLVGGIF